MAKKEKQNLKHSYQKFMKLSHLHQLGFLFIVFSGSVMIWRGIYNLMNVFWFPNNFLVSNISGVVIGLFIVASTHYAVRKITI